MLNRRFLGALSTFTLFAASLGAQVQQSAISYPATKQVEHVDDYFGTKVADPYRWMEELDAPDVKDWVAKQNAVTQAQLAQMPMREHFKQRITELTNYPRMSLPFIEAGRMFYTRNSGLQKQSPWFMRNGMTGTEQMVFDPNALSADGSLAQSGFSPSPNGKYLLYGVSEGGADWRVLYVRDLASGRQLSDTVRWLKGGGSSWTKDGEGFYYSRYPEPEKGKQLQNAIRDGSIYYHRIGTTQQQDVKIYSRPDQPEWFVGGGVSEDGRYFWVYVNAGSTNNNRLYVADLGDPKHPKVTAPIKPLFEKGDASYGVIGNEGSRVFLQTDLGTPNGKIVSFDISDPSPAHWRTLVPEQKYPIDQLTKFKGGLAVSYLVDVKSEVRLFSLEGTQQGTIPLPGIGTAGQLSSREDATDVYYSFTSPLYPPSSFHFDPVTKRSTPWFVPKLGSFNPSLYETKEVFATSKDGTKVPVFLTMRKGMKLDGNNPAMLYGYGGFQINTQPGFSTAAVAWIEQGGVWGTVSMRGGTEYGEGWHRGGMLDKKQNVFDDFIAAGEYLVKEKISSPAKMGIMGGSNGGLLVGAVEEQRPDLFAVALPAVGVMDMLRYHKFTGGNAWATEYGSSDSSSQFPYLLKYSPVHNVKAGTCYPATLITTADHDDRVVPSHSYKFAAAMQAAQSCARPVLIRVETNASHGYRPLDKRIQEQADLWGFAAAGMGMRLTVQP
ncbi:MAG: prolyl endopeptidase [Gemmatimonadetes bacterium]|nr:prolyl endopeptidase [Gemmatimonadota bacterium]